MHWNGRPQADKLSTSFILLLKAISASNETEDKTREQWYSIHYNLLRKIRDLVRRKGATRKAWQEERTSPRKQRPRIIHQPGHPDVVEESKEIDVTQVAHPPSRSNLILKAIETLEDIEDQTIKQWHRTRDGLSQQLKYLRRRRQAGRDAWQETRKDLRIQCAELSKQLSDLEKEQKQGALQNSLSWAIISSP